jgi:hypothetical protein
MPNVIKLTAASVAMLDDQETTMSVTPVGADGTPTSFPPGTSPTVYSVDNTSLVTLTPSADGTSCLVAGVKGQAGTANITATFTNLDSTVATGTGTITQTIDPAELDISSLNTSFTPPVAQ